jgi:hypothetical protein
MKNQYFINEYNNHAPDESAKARMLEAAFAMAEAQPKKSSISLVHKNFMAIAGSAAAIAILFAGTMFMLERDPGFIEPLPTETASNANLTSPSETSGAVLETTSQNEERITSEITIMVTPAVTQSLPHIFVPPHSPDFPNIPQTPPIVPPATSPPTETMAENTNTITITSPRSTTARPVSTTATVTARTTSAAPQTTSAPTAQVTTAPTATITFNSGNFEQIPPIRNNLFWLMSSGEPNDIAQATTIPSPPSSTSVVSAATTTAGTATNGWLVMTTAPTTVATDNTNNEQTPSIDDPIVSEAARARIMNGFVIFSHRSVANGSVTGVDAFTVDDLAMMYFGTYGGNSVVIFGVSDRVYTDQESIVSVGGIDIKLNATGYELLVHTANGGFVDIRTAFEQGLLTQQNIIAVRDLINP